MRNNFQLALLALFTLGIAAASHAEIGIASYYADEFHGRKTASGELYDKNKLTGAHKTLPFGTIIKVTRLDNNKSVRVRINDRGPYIKGRIVDISRKAAVRLDIVRDGHAEVRIEIVENTGSLEASVPEMVTPAPATSATPPPQPSSPKIVSKPNPNPPQTVKKAVEKPAPVAKVKEIPKAYSIVPDEKPSEFRVKGQDYKAFDLYKIQVLRPERSGYGVQVASLAQYENVLKQVAQLQEQWFNNILISVEKGKDDNPLYKILLGPFPDEQIASGYKKELKKKKKIDGFIVKLAEIKY